MALVTCQCPAGGEPKFACTALATQEDFLCDECRPQREDGPPKITGCTFGIAGRPHMRLDIRLELARDGARFEIGPGREVS